MSSSITYASEFPVNRVLVDELFSPVAFQQTTSQMDKVVSMLKYIDDDEFKRSIRSTFNFSWDDSEYSHLLFEVYVNSPQLVHDWLDKLYKNAVLNKQKKSFQGLKNLGEHLSDYAVPYLVITILLGAISILTLQHINLNQQANEITQDGIIQPSFNDAVYDFFLGNNNTSTYAQITPVNEKGQVSIVDQNVHMAIDNFQLTVNSDTLQEVTVWVNLKKSTRNFYAKTIKLEPVKGEKGFSGSLTLPTDLQYVKILESTKK